MSPNTKHEVEELIALQQELDIRVLLEIENTA